MSGRHKMPPAGRRRNEAAATPEAAPEDVVADSDSSVSDVPDEAVAGAAGSDEAVSEETAADAVEPESAVPADESAEEASAEEASVEEEDAAGAEPKRRRARISWPVVLSLAALVLAVAAGVLQWQIVAHRDSDVARAEAVQAAKEITAEMLSYEPETVDQQLTAVRDRLTGEFLGTYTAMVNDIIPAAQAQQIGAVADVLGTGVVSAEPDRVEVVLYVNQAVSTAGQMPQKTLSIAQATMVKDGDRWLMSEYAPVQP
ncbi:hypothetical protein FR943_21210 [Mycobacterium sp. TNTM28]|uniref:Mce associated membrane protein n=1 Tax=[Mycobacterium] fortunisiensis TaxID=2600579 RepID=A0ABS6KS08_9MYCO|nr:hypothetical protein [[Mycobacterium] fortunisiensis]MBU9766351.1 hypothetical protein [[Mycobacterium] fortunisiensis]